MDLVEYFINHIGDKENAFYLEFAENFTDELHDFELPVKDQLEIIEEWRTLLYPSNPKSKQLEAENCLKFVLYSFWLYNNGYNIEGHSNLLSRIKHPRQISDGEFYNATESKFGRDERGSVNWSSRRKYINELEFKTVDVVSDFIDSDLNTLINSISTSNDDFCNKRSDDKLAHIKNVLENIMKPTRSGSYIDVPFSELTNGYITEESVRDFGNELQVFRHARPDSILKRQEYSEDQKNSLISYGIAVATIAYNYVNQN